MNGDVLRGMLSSWWRQAGMPALADLADGQAKAVLERIELMEWDGRPYADAEGA